MEPSRRLREPAALPLRVMGSSAGEQVDLDEGGRLRSLFLACDVNGSGRIERDDFGSLCAELRVRPAEAEAIFQRLDTDRDGAITFHEFARGFRGVAQPQRRRSDCEELPGEESSALGAFAGMAAATTGSAVGPIQAWREFELRLGEEAGFIPR